jgi:hypothetical protein
MRDAEGLLERLSRGLRNRRSLVRIQSGAFLCVPAGCLASEIDFDSTLVGGSEKLVRRVLEDQRLEGPSEAGPDLIWLVFAVFWAQGQAA